MVARTYGDEPYEIAKERYGPSHHFCGAYRGIMRGRKEASTRRAASMRVRERKAVALRDEAAFPLFKHGQVFYDIW